MSQQNQLTLILGRHEFQKKLETNTTRHWECSKWSSCKCKVTANTTGNQLLPKKRDCNDKIVHGRLQAKQIHRQMKETTRKEAESTN